MLIPKTYLFIVMFVFVLFVGLFLFSEIHVIITSDEVFLALSESIDESVVTPIVNEAKVEMLVTQSVAKLEQRQATRLKYLVSAYFAIWLIFFVYTFWLVRMQSELLKRLELVEKSRKA